VARGKAYLCDEDDSPMKVDTQFKTNLNEIEQLLSR